MKNFKNKKQSEEKVVYSVIPCSSVWLLALTASLAGAPLVTEVAVNAQRQVHVVTERLIGSAKVCCLPWVCSLPQYFLQLVYEVDEVRQAFDMFPEWVRLRWRVALPPQLDDPHERRQGLRSIPDESNANV